MTQEPVREFHLGAGQESLGPVAKLSHLILSEAILTGAGRIRLREVDADKGDVEYETASGWRLVMQIPSQPFGAVVQHLKRMGGLGDGQQSQAGEVRVHLGGALRVLPIETALAGTVETVTVVIPVASAS